MVTRTVVASGDTTGVTDTAAIAAANALMGAGDTLVLASGEFYLLPTGDGAIINANANNQTFTFGSGTSKCSVYLVGKGAASTEASIIKVTGFTGVTIQGSPTALLDGGRAAIAAANVGGEMIGACVLISNQAVWGSDNAIVVKNLDLKDGYLAGIQLNSLQGGAITNVKSWATSDATAGGANVATGGGHGNDVDAVALNKPTKDVTYTNCDLDSYAAECIKLENATSMTFTSCTFRNVVTLNQDNGDAYSELGPIVFTACTFYGYIRHARMKRKGIAAVNKPAANLTLGSAAIGAGVAVTASAGVFAAGDVNKYIAAIGSSGTLGLAQITAFTSSTSVTVTNIQTWAGTSVTSQTWSLGSVDQTGSGAVTYTNCTFAGDAAVAWGADAVVANYGTLTFNNCTAYDDDGVVGGSNLRVFPSGVTYAGSGNTGLRSNVIHYVKPKPPARISSGHYADGGVNGVYSYPSSWGAAQAIGDATTSGRSSAGDEIVVMDGTYYGVAGTNTETESLSTANRTISTNGVAITVRAKHKWKAILDGTGMVSSVAVFSDSTGQPVGSGIRGFKVQNWTAGTNNMGAQITAVNGNWSIRDMWFHNITTQAGGAGVKIQSTGAPSVLDCVFTSCSTTVGTGGGGLYTSAVNGRYERLYFDGCSTSVQMGSAARFDFGSVAPQAVTGIVAVNCSATGTVNGAIGGKNFTLLHYTAANNTATGSPVGADLYTVGGTIVLKNSILRSATPITTPGGATLQYSFNNYAAAPTGVGTNTDQGNNSTTDPRLTGGYRLPSASAAGYRSGKVVEHCVDMDGNQRYAPPSLGAYELLGDRSASSTRTAATTRTAYLGRKLRGYP